MTGKITAKSIEAALVAKGYTGFRMWKSGGVWYLVAGGSVKNENIERCLHAVCLGQHALDSALRKAEELTA